ncbi:DICT sensory domain-containing protein [Nocardioides rubriscoriae]|uniref:DICT sensory domain-containing protein n=1 Tax=Nocardioides rubriscoriae TaxID=642762 RepID=UPI001479369A|nr:DICT sensory domain-containing protein [Nocardioides rubriscoriae]
MSNSETEAALSIGDLADRTGVSAATLRVWESRHGFPVPHRRESGHRRYDEQHVLVIRDVVRRRDDGVRLDVAIEQAVAARRPTLDAPGAPSVYARLRHTHPGLTPQRLTKRTLLALSWAIEDEFASRVQPAHLFGAFQRTQHYQAAEPRWDDLARTMGSTYVFADFEPTGATHHEPRTPVPVALPSHHPMAREWAVVCDGPELPVALTAWEIPGQAGVRDGDRLFESVWTVERDAVREASRVCALVARDFGAAGADEVTDELAAPLPTEPVDLAQVTSLFNRVVAYTDRNVRAS